MHGGWHRGIIKNMEIVFTRKMGPDLSGSGPWMFCEMLVHMSIWPISALGVSHLGTHHQIIINFPDYKKWVFISVKPSWLWVNPTSFMGLPNHTHIKHTQPNQKYGLASYLNHTHHVLKIIILERFWFSFLKFPTLNPHAYTCNIHSN